MCGAGARLVLSYGPSLPLLPAIGGGAEYIDEAVPGMKAHSLALWNSLTSVEQKRFNLVKA